MGRHNRMAVIAARIERVERKCNRIIAEVRSLRKALTPTYSEIDEVIAHLQRTAGQLREQSRYERRQYERIAREV